MISFLLGTYDPQVDYNNTVFEPQNLVLYDSEVKYFQHALQR